MNEYNDKTLPTEPADQTIQDFGEQWTHYQDNDGYYGSLEFFKDICGPLLSSNEIRNTTVAEIGSGTGRIVNMLLDAKVKKVIAVEPSQAFEVLKTNTQNRQDQIEYLQMTGEKIPENLNIDYIFSIGVLHHIKTPEPVVAAAYGALKPGGKLLIWLYGHEGNETYLRYILPLRKITIHLPHLFLAGLCHCLNFVLGCYIFLCKFLALPLRGYMNNVLAKITRATRYLVIYDQLNPTIAKYYKEAEAKALLENANFKDIQLYHRHGYSWTVIGTKSTNVDAATK